MDTWRKHEARVQHEEGHSIKRVWYAGSREPSDTPPNQNYLAFAPKGIASTSLNSQGFRLLYEHRRRRLGSPWVGLINAGLKRLKLGTVTLDAASTLSASSAFLFLCHFSDAVSSSLTHAAINLQPPSHTELYQTPGPSAGVLRSAVMPNSRRSFATQSVYPFSFPPGPRFPVFSSSPDMTLLGNLWSPMRSSAPEHNNFLVCTVVSIISHLVRWGGFCWTRCVCSATCTRLLEFEATSCDVLHRYCCRSPSWGPMSRIRIGKPLLPRISPSRP